MPRSGRGQAAGTPGPVPGWWLAVCATAVTVVAAAALGRLWGMGLVLGPLLAIPAALAGIGAPAPRREVLPEQLELLAAPADPDAEADPVARQHRGSTDALGDLEGVADRGQGSVKRRRSIGSARRFLWFSAGVRAVTAARTQR